MKHLTILVPAGEDNNVSSIIGTYKIWSRANEYWKKTRGRHLFAIELAGIQKRNHYYDGLFSVKPHAHISEIKKTTLIIVPSLNHHYEAAVKKNRTLIEWLAGQYQKGSAVASICTGAFLLAASGILDGVSCSTHWSAVDDFRARFPLVCLQPDRLITDEKGIYTSGGAYSFLNLILYLVEKYFDRETAIYCAKVFQVEIDRDCQSPFIIFSGQKQHGDETVQQAQHYIEKNPGDKMSVEALAARFAVSRRNFDRRFIKATGNTPVEYMQRVKVEAAKKLFETGTQSVNEIMYQSGYSDAKAFREVFRKITGLSPLAYKKKYNKAAAV